MTLKEIAQSALAEDAAVSPASAEPSAGNIDLAAHDRRFHPHGYDPKRDSCSLRADLDKGDNPDAAVGSAPSPQGDGWNPAERAEAERAAAALRRILGGVSVTFSDKPYSGNSDTRKSIRQDEFDRWNKIINDYERGALKPNEHLTVLEHTPPVLLRLGANDLPININKDTIDKIGGLVATHHGEFHKIPPSELRNLQIELDNPIAVFYSKSRNDSLVVLTRIIDRENNERAVVALHLDKIQGAIQVNDIASVYGKGKQSIENWTAWGLLGYVNKSARKASAKWFQLPPDSALRAHSVLTEKDFSGEELGTIVPNSSAERNGGSEDSLIRSDTGKVVGEYDRSTGKITLYPGAKVADVVHEFSHGFWQFAEEEAAAGRRSLLDKMHEIAVSAPKSVKDAVSADYPDASDSVYLEECFTHEMARRSDTAFAKAIDSDEGKPWYRKAWGAIKSIWNGYASKHGADKADIDKVASLPPAEAADFILGEMARGKKFGTVSHSGKDGGKRKSIIGEKGAAALGIGKLDEAQKMSKDGASRDDIWRKTGWWRGKDGKWRVEIPDIKLTRLVDTIPLMFVGRGHAAHVQAVEKLGELIEKGEVLSAYPDLASLDVHFTHLPNGALGRYDRENNAIWIERDLTEDPARKTELHSTLSHEIQHAIQDREGHASGGNLNTLEQGKRRIQDINKWLSGWMKDYGFKKWEEQTPQEDIIASLGRYSGRPFPQYLAFIDTLTRGDRNNAETVYKKAVKDLEKAKKIVPDTHYYDGDIDFYRSLSGEVESRNVEKRLAMSPEERAATPPWETEDVPEDRQIVRDSAPAFDPRAFARYLAQN